LKIVGDGPREQELRNQIKDLNMEEIIEICHGTDAIMQEYLNASIFVMSSRYEGLPMVLIEAKACGLPVVSFDCPEGPGEIIRHNEDGLLVKANDVPALAAALVSLMQDKEKRAVFGVNARKSINIYRPENIFRLWDDLFKSLRKQ
jgi:glycosyltransferase involved in cell wall biosynthesis